MALRFSLLAALTVVLGATPASAQFDCTSQASGDFSDTATWSSCGGGVPDADDAAIVTNGTTVTLDVNASVRGLEVNAGGTFDNGTSTLTAVDPSNAFLVNNGTFDGNGGTFVFAQQGAVSGSAVTAFHNVTLRAGVDFATSSGSSTLAGTLTIEAGGSIRDAGGGATPPTYQTSSMLLYDTGGA